MAMAFVDGGERGLVQADGGHRESAVLCQVGEVGGGDLGRRRQGEVAAALGPGLEGAPGGGVHLSGVLGDAGVQGVAESLDVGGAQAGDGRRWESVLRLLGQCN